MERARTAEKAPKLVAAQNEAISGGCFEQSIKKAQRVVLGQGMTVVDVVSKATMFFYAVSLARAILIVRSCFCSARDALEWSP